MILARVIFIILIVEAFRVRAQTKQQRIAQDEEDGRAAAEAATLAQSPSSSDGEAPQAEAGSHG